MFGAVLLLLAAGPFCGTVTAGPRSCAVIAGDLAAARSAGRLADVVALDAEATRGPAGCDPKTLSCLGRSTALAHAEAADAAAAQGLEGESTRLMAAGRTFGAPWPLLAGLGDAKAAAARAGHDPAAWAAASQAYQRAVAELDEPHACPGEPAEPDAASAGLLLRKMALSMLLAQPAPLVADRCAPCAVAFLAHGPIDSAHPRTLPITFVAGSATMTPEGFAAAKGLAACASALRWERLDMAVHTDERGGAALNRRLSERRAAALRDVFARTGFSGRVAIAAVGAEEPLVIDDPTGLSAAEVERANRRVELLGIAGAAPPPCAAAGSKGP